MAENEKDVPGVIVFPPLVPFVALVVGGTLDWLLPLSAISAIPFLVRAIPGAALVVLGLALALRGEHAFKRAGTNVFPFRPSLAIAHDGVYARLRNPMYVGMGLALLGVVLAFALEWTFLVAIPGALLIHYGVVLREERYLERKFGEDYRAYKRSVPRYGFRF